MHVIGAFAGKKPHSGRGEHLSQNEAQMERRWSNEADCQNGKKSKGAEINRFNEKRPRGTRVAHPIQTARLHPW